MFLMGIILVPFICHFSNTIFIVLLFLFYHFGNCWVLVLVFSPPFGTFVVADCLTYFYQAACYQGPVYKVIIYKSRGEPFLWNKYEIWAGFEPVCSTETFGLGHKVCSF